MGTQTNLAYLTNNEALETQATILKAEKGEIILDTTVFHPQGGGQPADQGKILSPCGTVFNVKHVTIDKESGTVTHVGETENFEVFQEGVTVNLQVSSETRCLHMRLHSAGHLFDLAIQRLGYPWTANKGYHFPAGPYNEYSASEDECKIVTAKKAEIIAATLEEVKKIEIDNPSVFTEWEKDEKTKEGTVSCWDQRFLCFGETRGLCAGTHVKQGKEVFCKDFLENGECKSDEILKIRKMEVKAKTGRIKLCYNFEKKAQQ